MNAIWRLKAGTHSRASLPASGWNCCAMCAGTTSPASGPWRTLEARLQQVHADVQALAAARLLVCHRQRRAGRLRRYRNQDRNLNLSTEPTQPEDLASLDRRAFAEYGARGMENAPRGRSKPGGRVGDHRGRSVAPTAIRPPPSAGAGRKWTVSRQCRRWPGSRRRP